MTGPLNCCSFSVRIQSNPSVWLRLCSILLGAMVVAVAGTALAQPVSPRAKLEPSLRSRLELASDSDVIDFSVVIEDDALQRRRLSTAQRQSRVRVRQQEVLDTLPQWSDHARRLENVSGFSGRGTRTEIETIAGHPLVERVYLDIELQAFLAEGVPLIGADHAAILGVTGSGINVAVVDSGIMTNHVDLEDAIVGEACFCRDSAGAGCCPNGSDEMVGEGSGQDFDGHGTMVAGIIASRGNLSSAGVAPGAGLVAIKVVDSGGSGPSAAVVDTALDWLLTNHALLGVRVINMSLGTESTFSDEAFFPCLGTVTAVLIEDLAAAGVATFVASGNGGVDDGISFPACVPDAISVGGIYDADVGAASWPVCSDQTSGPDEFVCHTNSSSILDMLAPDWQTDTTALGGGGTAFGGTSAASPYAAGLAALLLEQDSLRMPSDLKALLTSDSPLVTNSENGLSFPRADVSAQFQICGDSEVSGAEECDDGNTVGGDCCSEVCEFEELGSSCDDSDACTVAEICDGVGSCDSGAIVSCDDGLYCNGTETCDSSLGCQAGVAPELDDGVGCTADVCDESLDVVTHTANSGLCDNGFFCDGIETCDAVLDCQEGVAPELDDGVDCTVDSCNDEVAGVLHLADHGLCEDSDPCTADICDAILGCQNEPIPECAVAVSTGRPWVGPVLGVLLVLTSLFFRRGLGSRERLFVS